MKLLRVILLWSITSQASSYIQWQNLLRPSLLLRNIEPFMSSGITQPTALGYECSSSISSSCSSSRMIRKAANGYHSRLQQSRLSATRTSSHESKKLKQDPIYSAPALYDLAVGYRNFEEEVAFMFREHKKCCGKEPSSILELAAGPARHSIASLGFDTTKKAIAIDLEQDMVDYGKSIAAEELDPVRISDFDYLCKDMRAFDLDESVDSAWIVLGSLQHLNSNTDAISCFQAIHKALVPGGTFVIELPHPSELFMIMDCTRNDWEVPLEDDEGKSFGELAVIWGDEDDDFDPVSQIRKYTVSMQLKGVENPENQGVQDVVPMRMYTAQEIDLLARLAGFEIVNQYGALSEEVSVDNEDQAFRLVCILRKT